MYKTYILLLILFACRPSIAQINEHDFVLHTRNHGLSHNYVTGIVQDEKGYIWLSTLQGLNRYDGTEYFPISLKQFNCFDEYGDIWRMKYFGNNEIGITSGNGAFAFNTQTLNYRSFIAPPLFGNNRLFNKCRDIEKLPDSTYATSTGTGFYIFDRHGKLLIRKDGVKQDDLGQKWFQFGATIQRLQNGTLLQENGANYFAYHPSKKTVNELMPDGSAEDIKKILRPDSYVITIRFFPDKNRQQGLIVLNRVNNTLDLVSDYEKPFITQSLPLPFSIKSEISWQSDLFFLSDTTFAVTLSSSGFYLFHYNKKTGKVSIDPHRYFPSYFVTSVFADKNKNIWIGTDKGLLRMQKQLVQAKIFDIAKIADIERPLQVRGIYKDEEHIYAGGRFLTGLLILHPETKQLQKRIFLNNSKDTSNNINSIIASPVREDELWLCTGKGIYWFNKKSERYGPLHDNFPDWLREFYSYYCSKDSRGNLWFRHNTPNVISWFDIKEKKFHVITPKEAGDLFRIAIGFGVGEDQNGNMWFSGDGICRWNPRTQKVDSLIPLMKELNTDYDDYYIFDTDPEHYIWMTTAAGIYKWNPVTGKSRLFTTKDGLPYNISLAYPSADRDHLFVHTHQGMGWFDRRTAKTIVFTEKDGIPQPANLQLMSHCFDKRSREYLFSYDDLLIALPMDFQNYSPPPQSLNISMLHINHDTTIFHPSPLTNLNHHQNDLGICYNAVNFVDPENHSFAYRIFKDNNTPWIGTGKQSTIYLNDLPHGTYQLQVKLSAINKRWPDIVKEITIVIEPPYWKKSWFLSIASVIAVTLIFFIYWKRVTNIRQKANLDKLLAQTEMKALHAQMNPHFIFNCLNSINEMILLNETTQASHYLSKFAHLIRTTLDHSTREWVTLRQTIDYLQRYIELEKIRRSDFSFIVETDKSLRENDTFLPPMLIQPLLENAIWHGKNKEVPLEIKMRFERENDQLLCIVTDNGIGIDEARKQKQNGKLYESIGISNIQQRIRLLNEKYNLHSELILEDRKGSPQSGTIATLRLPLKTTDS